MIVAVKELMAWRLTAASLESHFSILVSMEYTFE